MQISKHKTTKTIIIISDSYVWKKYQNYILKMLKKNNSVEIIKWIGPRGEKLKSIKNYELATNHILSSSHDINKNSTLIAIGGGAVSDFAGFIASTLLRGIKWTIIPTTLLSMVDASIGGKTALNTAAGKNLLGTFYPPSKIIVDLHFLKSLSMLDYYSGYGEIIKYAFLSSKINKLLKRLDKVHVNEKIINECIAYKNKIVKQDPREEKGIRTILNFGHTFGHAFEKAFNLPHGIAVLWGIEFILRHFSKNQKLLSTFYDFTTNIANIKIDLYKKKANPSLILNFICKDKKRSSSTHIKLVTLEKIGKPRVIEVTINDIRKKLIKEFGHEYIC
ncbi:MAG: 3-dehydroquinate synthase [Oligoflexia bacterium]|nr:3-dehydroquinate synthase [Oligoflexia bacterium]